MNRPRRSIEERFWGKVKKGSGCWQWCGAVDKKGYGFLTWSKIGGLQITRRAHRAVWALTHGCFPPPGVVVMHICDNRRCVRPDHLRLGTVRDNALDAAVKGRLDAKLTPSKVRQIRQKLSSGRSEASVAREYKVGNSTVHDIKRRDIWNHVQ